MLVEENLRRWNKTLVKIKMLNAVDTERLPWCGTKGKRINVCDVVLE